MPRHENLSDDQLKAIRRFIEEADSIDAANAAEIEDLRALVEKRRPHQLLQTTAAHGALALSWQVANRGVSRPV
jgi:hypothetical protein